MMLILDTLDPPSPDQLVFDCMALGADGCWAYVLRRAANGSNLGVGGWTPLHADTLHASSKVCPGIVVPGNVPPLARDCIDALRAMHCDPVMADDLEQFSLPPTWFEDQLESAEDAQGIVHVDYGTGSVLDQYDPGDPNWLANWIRTGILNPIPALPAGRRAWQFVNDVRAPSGVQYDVSVVDPALFPALLLRGDSTMFHPTIAGRVDSAWLGADGNLYHTWSQIFQEPPHFENWGRPAGISIVPGTVKSDWSPTDGGQHFLVEVTGSDGQIYYRQENLQANADGSPNVEHDWTPLTAAGLPRASSALPLVDIGARKYLQQIPLGVGP